MKATKTVTLPTCDLTRVIARIKKHNTTLTDAELKAAETAYREFWAQCKAADGASQEPPTTLADEIWHTHIYLSTLSYEQDCLGYFGYILHHEAHPEGSATTCDSPDVTRPATCDSPSVTRKSTCGSNDATRRASRTCLGTYKRRPDSANLAVQHA